MPTKAISTYRSILLILAFALNGHAQNATGVPVAPDAAIVQIRKSVAFIKLTCTKANTTYEVRGTGFFVNYPDARTGNPFGFGYLVTNRHVALCWDDAGLPMHVTSVAVSLNLKSPDDGRFVKEVILNATGNIPWTVPIDESVDLAAVPLVPNADKVEIIFLPTTMFATKDLLVEHSIHEGEPVFFSGFFTQFPGIKRMEPIVREGIIAMMPDEQIPFVGQPRRLYLADMHVFHGNSGSPAFINLGGIHEGNVIVGQDYRLLGVVQGEVFEDEDFNLTLAATVAGKALANSGVSTIVPVDDLKALLDDARFQKMRDDVIKQKDSRQPAK